MKSLQCCLEAIEIMLQLLIGFELFVFHYNADLHNTDAIFIQQTI